MEIKSQLDPKRLPRHVALIMDGNGRWAKQKGKERIFGHEHGVKAVRRTLEAAGDLKIPYITIYAFSTENWDRPKKEVDTLMELLVNAIRSEIKELCKKGIRLHAIGNLDALPQKCLNELNEAINITKNNNKLNLIVALSYSARWEIINAVKKIAEDIKGHKINESNISQELFDKYLTTSGFPDPDLLIRTSGELRISNFLLWQIAYSELYFTPVLWPDFSKEHFYEAILDYQKRERRFGKTKKKEHKLSDESK